MIDDGWQFWWWLTVDDELMIDDGWRFWRWSTVDDELMMGRKRIRELSKKRWVLYCCAKGDRNSPTSKKGEPMKMKMNGDTTKTNNESRTGCLMDDELMMLRWWWQISDYEFGLYGVKWLAFRVSFFFFFFSFILKINYLMNCKIQTPFGYPSSS